MTTLNIDRNDQDDDFNVEILITEVEKRPALYDITSKEYSDRNIKQRLWAEVCQNLFRRWGEMTENQQKDKGKEVQNKWRNLKDRFRKELALQRTVQSGQAAKKKKKYYYFDNLLFLMPSMNHQPTISNIDAQNSPQVSECNDEIQNTQSSSSRFLAPRTDILAPLSNSANPIVGHRTIQKKKAPTFEEQLINILKEKSSSEADIDEDKNFAFMLIPMMKKLNDEQKFFAKTEILRVMRQAKHLEYIPPVCTYMPTMHSYLPPQNTIRGSNTYMSTPIPSPSPTPSTSSSSRQSLYPTTPTLLSSAPSTSTLHQDIQIATETTNYVHNYYEQFGQSMDEDSELFDVTNL